MAPPKRCGVDIDGSRYEISAAASASALERHARLPLLLLLVFVAGADTAAAAQRTDGSFSGNSSITPEMIPPPPTWRCGGGAP